MGWRVEEGETQECLYTFILFSLQNRELLDDSYTANISFKLDLKPMT